MSTTHAVSLEEYRSTTYHPDCEFLDGELQERNVGKPKHSHVQLQLGRQLAETAAALKAWVGTEMRMQVASGRFRIPDLVFYLDGMPSNDLPDTPPFLCAEILSPDDSFSAMQERISDYFRMGVQYIWVVDPDKKVGYVLGPEQRYAEVRGSESLRTASPEIAVPLDSLFQW